MLWASAQFNRTLKRQGLGEKLRQRQDHKNSEHEGRGRGRTTKDRFHLFTFEKNRLDRKGDCKQVRKCSAGSCRLLVARLPSPQPVLPQDAGATGA